jgi:regulatory protein
LNWLSRREYSELEIQQRLIREGYADDEIRAALTWLAENNWQSDQRFALSLARRRASTFGSRLIRAELEQHKVESADIQQALEDLDIPEHERAIRWLQKRSQGRSFTPENRAKWFRALMARGFSPDNIKQAFRHLNENLPRDPEDPDDRIADFG